ncbi:hypothetical protein [Candidatus Bodocaedibacter vickermanii]|uniref:Uncharacterized protein n=1 Tax=Candidatus Bodocaedibacter vickermanii TaxID=2741701 RepID=A0A7L9RSA6_9PROT|nr:hypothetical protein CPBP_00168 [Candidatus Paracaedibacteraceae bacterium 'Lake Konstanz']
MTDRYTKIEGLSFPKHSDREYQEHWESRSDHLVIRKTIQGDAVIEGHELRTLTLSGNGDVLPKCTLKVGDSVTIKPRGFDELIVFRFEKWGHKYSPWDFNYSWRYVFAEVAS